MTLREFKRMACCYGKMYDNSEEAAKEWRRTWGLSWWRNLWRYKEYTYNGYTYRSGRVYTRHTNYMQTEFLAGENEIPKRDFLKAIKNMEYKELELQSCLNSTPCVQQNFGF